jgi:hypothetical protein
MMHCSQEVDCKASRRSQYVDIGKANNAAVGQRLPAPVVRYAPMALLSTMVRYALRATHHDGFDTRVRATHHERQSKPFAPSSWPTPAYRGVVPRWRFSAVSRDPCFGHQTASLDAPQDGKDEASLSLRAPVDEIGSHQPIALLLRYACDGKLRDSEKPLAPRHNRLPGASRQRLAVFV